MRLINVTTLQLEELFYPPIPRYAILSHTWGTDEVLYSHIREGGYKAGSSAKIDGCIAQAIKDTLGYVWIDTCCIDKSSSAELSEAINSMFTWYRWSMVCYAYLDDVPDELEVIHVGGRDPGDSDSDDEDDNHCVGADSAFAKSRWFTRGWTLQELLAPDNVVFFSSGWMPIGRKVAKSRPYRYSGGMMGRLILDTSPVPKIDREIPTISAITRIPFNCLSVASRGFKRATVAQKMSWAAGRDTTRLEDRAYSLLGIFGVNMPMLYGEGGNAFVRLQEEILRLSDDQSILAWGYGLPPPGYSSLLADSPDAFAACGNICRVGFSEQHYTMTNKGLQISLQISDVLQPYDCALALLQCGIYHRGTFWPKKYEHIVLPLRFYKGTRGYSRDRNRSPMLDPLGFKDRSYLAPGMTATYLTRSVPPMSSGWYRDYFVRFWLVCDDFDLVDGIRECYPEAWKPVLRKGEWPAAYIRCTLGNTMIFLYTGGQFPPFIADTLAELIHWALARKTEESAEETSRWYSALLDIEEVQWKTDSLVTDDGTTLSARVGEDAKGKVIIRFGKRLVEPPGASTGGQCASGAAKRKMDDADQELPSSSRRKVTQASGVADLTSE